MENAHVAHACPLARVRLWVRRVIETIPSDDLRADASLWAGAIVGALHAVAHPNDDPRIADILATVKRIETMGQTISQQQDANTAKLVADLVVIKVGIADLKAQLASVPPPVAGQVVTQAQEDAFAAAVTTADTMAVAFAPTEPPVEPPAVVFDPTDPTPNAPGGRNSSQLPDFDASMPETP